MAARPETAAILDDLRSVVDEAEQLMHDVDGEAGGRTAAARERLAERLAAARARLTDLETELRTRARAAADDTDRYVRTHPWQSVGVAAAVGLLVGLLVARR